MFKKILMSAICLTIVGFSTIAFAQTTDQTSQNNSTAEGLTISPPVVEINLEPGNSYEKQVKITNPTNNLVELYPIAMNFGPKDETGTPTFLPADDDSYTFAMAKWVSFDTKKIALTSQQVVDFSYTIKVPANAEPGGHYGVLFFSTKAPELSQDQSQVAISSQVGVLILGKVAGDVTEQASVEEFTVAKKFYLKAPVDFSARIRNSGNVHFKPKGDVTIKNMFGSEIGKVTFNEIAGNVLPQSIRKFDIQWKPDQNAFYKIPIGRFTANLAATYGENNQNLSATISFWIIPLWFIIALGIVILLIIFLIVWSRRRKNNQPIIQSEERTVAPKLNGEEKNEEEIKIEDYSKKKDSDEKEE